MATQDPSYALTQLQRAFQTAAAHADPMVRQRASERTEQWLRVIDGIRSGTLAIGSRTPTAAPAWATLDVVHGGFATGDLAAGGPPLAHEVALAARLGVDVHDRGALALHFLADAGRAELNAMLASGCYRIDVPEEGAMLAVAALLSRGAVDRAADVVDAIAPYLDQLRFYPQPSTRAVEPVSTVHVASVGELRAKLAALETPIAVRRMNEALTVWAPLTDRAVALFLETVTDGQPGRQFADDWQDRATVLLADHAAARSVHRLCAKPHNRKGNLAILVAAIAKARVDRAALSARELGMVRVALEGHVRKHGAPGSDQHTAHRSTQARVAGLLTRGESAAVLASRLAALPADGGIASVEAIETIGGPISEGARAGTPLPSPMVAKLARCLDASIEELVERGVLTSGEAIARVLPQVSAHVRALGFVDPEIARLYAALDVAFRRRRSLLLLNYEHQVRLEELPWVAALEPLRSDDGTSKAAARRMFSSVTALAIESFPHAIVPNPLLVELRALAKRAELAVPFVDELAADIFMGGFTAKFVRAAQISARRLEGTLYARYFGLPIAEVSAITVPVAKPPSLGERLRTAFGMVSGTPSRAPAQGPIPAFGALCERMAAIEPGLGVSVARNGRIIEQQQILTTQNLVPLIDAAQLAAERFPDLARRSFEWLVQRVQMKVDDRIERLRTAKNAAYAWRQAIVFLSLSPTSATDDFLVNAHAHLREQSAAFRARFEPILAGLEDAHAGQPPRLRLLGWTTGAHPLVEP